MSIQQNINQLLSTGAMMAGIAKRVYQESPTGQAKVAEAKQTAQEKRDQDQLTRVNELYAEAQAKAAEGLNEEEADIFFDVQDAPLERKQEIVGKIAATPEGNVSLANMRGALENEIGLRSKRLSYVQNPYAEYERLQDVQVARNLLDKMSRQVKTKEEFKDFYESLDGGDN